MTVELPAGAARSWPWPGRIFAVGPSHTFNDLADAVNAAFGRWDRSHLSLFTLDDGRLVTDGETGAEQAGSIDGPIIGLVDIAVAKVAQTLDQGAECRFTFDLGDQWSRSAPCRRSSQSIRTGVRSPARSAAFSTSATCPTVPRQSTSWWT